MAEHLGFRGFVQLIANQVITSPTMPLALAFAKVNPEM
jgi:hypothetical protein